MPNFTSSFDFGSGQLNALQQGDALGGAQGPAMAGGDMGGLVDKIISERRRKEQQARTDMRMAQNNQPAPLLTRNQQRNAAMASLPTAGMPYGSDSGFAEGQRFRNFNRMYEGQRTAPQRAVSAAGGTTGQAFSDMARQMNAMQAAGLPVADYTGLTEMAKAGAGASEAAVNQAGANFRQQSPAALQLAALGRG